MANGAALSDVEAGMIEEAASQLGAQASIGGLANCFRPYGKKSHF
jgi:hypothetical protein